MALPIPGITLEQFLRLPEEKPALEYEDGMVTQKLSPQLEHGLLQTEIAKLVDTHGVPSKIAKAFTEVRTTFAGRAYVPDVAVFRWHRIPRRPNGRVAREAFIPPDISFEIGSPDQSRRLVEVKCLWYVANGVPVAVMVDPNRDVVGEFRPDRPPRTLTGLDLLDLGCVPGLKISAGAIFDWLVLE